MKIERRKNTKRNIFFGILNNIVSTVLPFVVKTIMIHVLGMEYVGIKGLFSSILSILSLSELGVGSAIIYSMYKPVAEDDYKTLCALLNLYKELYRLIGAVILVIGIVVTPFIPRLINGTYPDDINLYLVFDMYLINTVLSYFLAAYKSSLLNAYQRTDVSSNIGSFIRISVSTFQIVILLLYKNFYAYLLVEIIFTVISNCITSITVDKMFPTLKAQGSPDKNIIQSIKSKVAGLLIGNICGKTRNTFDNIFMSMFLGLTQSAMYSNYYSILNTLTGFTTIILSSMLAGVGNSIVIESKDKNFHDMMIMNYVYLIISGWMTTCMVCLYQPFMIIWVGKEYIFPFYTMILFPIYFYITKMGDIRGVYSDADGLFWENRYCTLAEAVANIILNYLFVQWWGAFGIILATIITLFFIGFLGSTYVIFKHYFDRGKKEYLLSELFCGLVTLAVSMVSYRVCTFFSGNEITIFIKRLIICITLSPALFYLCFFKTKVYKEIKPWLITIIKK